MKKIICFLLVFTMVLSEGISVPALSGGISDKVVLSNSTDGEINWEDGALYEDDCLISVNPELSGEFEIKEGTKAVLNGAFAGCTDITDIKIPDSMERIAYSKNVFGDTSFYKNESNWENGALYKDNCLIAVKEDLSGSFKVKEETRLIAEMAFWSVGEYLAPKSQITEIILPESVDYIGDSAFDGCKSLLNIEMPSTVKYLGLNAFRGCNHLEKIVLPDGIKHLGSNMFTNAYSLKEIVFPVGLESIGAYAFQGSGFIEIHIPDTVTEIGVGAFYSCSDIVNIKLPKNLTEISDWLFGYCNSLKSVKIPDSVTEIGESAFAGTTFKSIIIPESVTVIDRAFTESYLEEVYILGNPVFLDNEYEMVFYPHIIIHGYPDSTTDEYANLHGNPFVPINENEFKIKGDMDGNSVLDVNDMSSLKAAVLSDAKNPDFLALGDMDNNGVLDVNDLTALKAAVMSAK